MTKYTKDKKKFLYFYINGKLHKMIKVVRSRDEALAWCYSEHQRRMYLWSDIKKRASRGFKAGEAAKIFNKSSRMIHYYIEYGLIDPPERTYSLTTGRPGMYIFSEEDMEKLRDINTIYTRGFTNKDGVFETRKGLSQQELYAKIKYDMTLYTKNKDGEFIPLYAAEDW
jgi:hypothetical protein